MRLVEGNKRMTKQRILAKALELFTEKGYEGSSMDDIAKAVGIRKASLYAHFDGKERIFAAIFDDILEEYTRVIDQLTACSEEPAVERLTHIYLSFIDYCIDNQKMYFWDRYFYYPPAFWTDFIREKTLETETLFLARIRWWMQRAMTEAAHDKCDAEGMALAYYYSMIGLSMSVKLYDRKPLLEEAQAALRGLCLGMERGCVP